MKEDAIMTFNRRLRILAMFRNNGESLTTQTICSRLRNTGDEIEERSVQRTLQMLHEAGYLDIVNPDAKPLEWRWPTGKPRITLPKMADQEILAFRLLDLFLKPLIPQPSYQALQPYFQMAQNELEGMIFYAPVRTWENKVRVVPPTQPLLPSESPMTLASEQEKQQWHEAQRQVQDLLLQALFEGQQCEIKYQQLWRDEPAHWRIHPLVYLQRGTAFYLLCTIGDFTDVRQLAVHRILSAQTLSTKVVKPTGFNVDREVERCQGMGGSGEPIALVARFWKPAGLHLLETRLTVDQTVEESGNDHFQLRATVNDTAQLRWWLLSFGSKVEVLEPLGLRETMANQAYWMNRIYG